MADGHDPNAVVRLAAEHPPGSPVWDGTFGRPTAPLSLIRPMSRPDPPTARTVEVEARPNQRVLGPITAIVCALLLAINCLGGMRRPGKRSPAPVDPRPEFVDDAVVKKIAEILSMSRVVHTDPVWKPEEVAGFKFRPSIPGRSGPSFTFHPNGTAVVVDEVLARLETWTIDADGVILVANPAGTTSTRLGKIRVGGDLYDIRRDEQVETYIRERP